MLDYLSADNALIVESDEEYCSWPQDPRNALTTTRHRVAWSSLVEKFREGHRLALRDTARYAMLSQAARTSIQAFCNDDRVSAKLSGFLGLGRSHGTATPSALIQLSAAP
jgi:hypothetical protein